MIAYLADGAVWPIDPKQWKDHAWQVAGRELTAAEWSDVLPGRQYRRVCPAVHGSAR